jgi:hypothetical protein
MDAAVSPLPIRPLWVPHCQRPLDFVIPSRGPWSSVARSPQISRSPSGLTLQRLHPPSPPSPLSTDEHPSTQMSALTRRHTSAVLATAYLRRSATHILPCLPHRIPTNPTDYQPPRTTTTGGGSATRTTPAVAAASDSAREAPRATGSSSTVVRSASHYGIDLP